MKKIAKRNKEKSSPFQVHVFLNVAALFTYSTCRRRLLKHFNGWAIERRVSFSINVKADLPAAAALWVIA